MVSVLIPTLRYLPEELVTNLVRQFQSLNIRFEIRIADDDPDSDLDYGRITRHEQVNVVIRTNNLGRFSNRMALAKSSQYKTLVFLDEDAQIDDHFVSRYAPFFSDTNKNVVFGGVKYDEVMPKPTYHLRWKVGVKREMASASIRNKTPYARLMTCNFLVPKDVFLKLPNHPELKGYGHEDTMMGYDLRYAFADVKHIDNPIRHAQLDDAETFLRKTGEAVANIQRLIAVGKIDEEVRLYRVYAKLRKGGMASVVGKYVHQNSDRMLRKLLRPNPPLRLLDLYKLGLLCHLDKDRK
ncbi:MAG: glycosyltransferase [Cryomorphaceae bacterium]|nr:glycosyltransferase [Cryomorphaceae bacterium]